jgi:hypothetical protein
MYSILIKLSDEFIFRKGLNLDHYTEKTKFSDEFIEWYKKKFGSFCPNLNHKFKTTQRETIIFEIVNYLMLYNNYFNKIHQTKDTNMELIIGKLFKEHAKLIYELQKHKWEIDKETFIQQFREDIIEKDIEQYNSISSEVLRRYELLLSIEY